MASISTSNGRRSIQFVDRDKKRRTVRLAKGTTQHDAESIKTWIERLNSDSINGVSIDGETAKWLASIADDLHSKLAAVGLVAARGHVNGRLGDFIDSYISRRTDVQAQSRTVFHKWANRLTDFFGRDKPMAEIKRSDADDWVVYLKSQYAPGTTARTIKGARQFFRAAHRAEVIRRNPFDDLKAGTVQPNKDRQVFISLDDTQRVIEKCPDAQWRLLVALARYGGLRCPSEHLALTWPDVDWERKRFRVDSPKTGERWVPIFSELRPYLEEAFELAPEGQLHVITMRRSATANLRTRFIKIIRRAALTPWPKPFQNLRASRETELAGQFPLHVVCDWIGNSTLIAKKHYLQVTEEDFQRAAKSAAVRCKKRCSKEPHEARTESQESSEDEDDCGLMRESATRCQVLQDGPMGTEGFEPPTPSV